MIPLAIAGAPAIGAVDEFGYIHLGDWRVEWWVAGDDHWHVPAASPSLRQRAVEHTPIVETAMRVPGGDVVWRVAATATADGGAIVAEFENRASIPVAIGIALVTPEGGPHDPMDRPSLHFTAPARSATAELGVELLVHPVTHGSTWRCSIGATPPDRLPAVDAIVRGWLTLARQRAQIALGDPMLDDALVAARTSLLLHQGTLVAAGRRGPADTSRAVATALTLLGYEDEAAALRVAARLRPQRRGLPLVAMPTPQVHTDSLALHAAPALAAGTVAAVRSMAVDDTQRRVVDVLPGADAAWRGRSVDVSHLPTNSGEMNFALRWHGDHPALLWEAPAKVIVRASGLDSGWSEKARSGEKLLGGPRKIR